MEQQIIRSVCVAPGFTIVSCKVEIAKFCNFEITKFFDLVGTSTGVLLPCEFPQWGLLLLIKPVGFHAVSVTAGSPVSMF